MRKDVALPRLGIVWPPFTGSEVGRSARERGLQSAGVFPARGPGNFPPQICSGDAPRDKSRAPWLERLASDSWRAPFRVWDHEPRTSATVPPARCCRRLVGRALLRLLCRQDAGSTLRFMESHLLLANRRFRHEPAKTSKPVTAKSEHTQPTHMYDPQHRRQQIGDRASLSSAQPQRRLSGRPPIWQGPAGNRHLWDDVSARPECNADRAQ